MRGYFVSGFLGKVGIATSLKMRQESFAPEWIRRCLYALGKNLFYYSGRLIWRLDVKGSERIPAKGPAIIACNHISFADPPIVGASIFRPMHFIAKQQLFEVPILGWLIRQVNAFPVRREERDVSAFKAAQRLLESGEAVLLFPEGTRSRSGKLGKAKPGVGMLAAKTGAPVVPACVHNTPNMKRFKKLSVRFGEPLSYDPRLDYQQFSDAVLARILKMQEEFQHDS